MTSELDPEREEGKKPEAPRPPEAEDDARPLTGKPAATIKLRLFTREYYDWMTSHPEVGNKILEKKDIDSDTENALRKSIQDFKVAGAY